MVPVECETVSEAPPMGLYSTVSPFCVDMDGVVSITGRTRNKREEWSEKEEGGKGEAKERQSEHTL